MWPQYLMPWPIEPSTASVQQTKCKIVMTRNDAVSSYPELGHYVIAGSSVCSSEAGSLHLNVGWSR